VEEFEPKILPQPKLTMDHNPPILASLVLVPPAQLPAKKLLQIKIGMAFILVM
jgi:hypothetical protein